jgi:hypothetical protein
MAKIGRNDPCPCGSGRKHKRCCLGSEDIDPATAAWAESPQGEEFLTRPDVLATASDNLIINVINLIRWTAEDLGEDFESFYRRCERDPATFESVIDRSGWSGPAREIAEKMFQEMFFPGIRATMQGTSLSLEEAIELLMAAMGRQPPPDYESNPVIPVYLASYGRGEPRMVRVPDDTPEEELLNAAFHYGQNDFQPQPAPSVSVGDVIRLPDGSLHRVMFAGFKRLPDGYNPLTLTGQDAWKDGYNLPKRRNPNYLEPLPHRLRRLCKTDFSDHEISDFLDVPVNWVRESCRTYRPRRNPYTDDELVVTALQNLARASEYQDKGVYRQTLDALNNAGPSEQILEAKVVAMTRLLNEARVGGPRKQKYIPQITRVLDRLRNEASW